MTIRKKLVTAVRQRLEQAERDPAAILAPEALAEAEALGRALDDPVAEPEASLLLARLYWYRVQQRPGGEDLDRALAMFAACFLADVPDDELPASLLPDIAERAVPAAMDLLARVLKAPNGPPLSRCLRVWQRIISVAPPDHAERPLWLHGLATGQWVRYCMTRDPADLDASVEASAQAVATIPVDRSERPGLLNALALPLQARFDMAGAMADLDTSIKLGREAVSSAPDGDPKLPIILGTLSVGLRMRFERTGDGSDLDEIIDTGRRAAAGFPVGHPRLVFYLNSLSGMLGKRFERTQNPADLDEVIETGQRAVEAAAAAPDVAYRAMLLVNLRTSLRERFLHTGNIADLDAAIDAARQAIASPGAYHAHLPEWREDLAMMKRVRRDAGPDTKIYRARALEKRFRQTWDPVDLDAAIAAARAVADDPSADDYTRAEWLNNLVTVLWTRFQRAGNRADLDEAIEISRLVARTAPADHVERATYLANLGGVLMTRFEQTGDRTDLDESIATARRAVAASAAGDPHRAAVLGNLAGALWRRFERFEDAVSLDEAVEVNRLSIKAVSGGRLEPGLFHNNLGNALRARFRRSGDESDLDAAIEAAQQALRDGSADSARRALFQSNLGIALRLRLELRGAPADLDASIDALRLAVSEGPGESPEHARYLVNLADALRERFRRSGAQADLDGALSAYTQTAAAATVSASNRIRAGRAAARLMGRTDPAAAARLYDGAIRLLPEMAPRALGREDQQHLIGGFAGLPAEAASLALSDPSVPAAERPARALLLLEAGRAVLYSQVLETRGDISDLRESHPELAARFENLRERLDRPTDGIDLDGGHGVPRRQLATEFAELLARIRAQPGFGSFALPPVLGELVAQAAEGPVVTFNVSPFRSDALLLTPEGVTGIELPGLSPAALGDHAAAFQQALATATARHASRTARDAAEATIRETLRWLWDVAATPVLTALGYDQPPPADQAVWPRVWWVPTGLLTVLPLHAAGRYPGTTDTVMDRVVSAYTPTIGTLRYARQQPATRAAGPGRSLIVAMPTTPERDDLPGVRAEAATVTARLPGSVLLEEPDDPSQAMPQTLPTRANVESHLLQCAIAHFACHGDIDPANPSQSLLLLHDHDHRPLTVARIAALRLGDARLAYLSACLTAAPANAALLDEAIQLSAAFQLAGFPHVVGTLWPVADEIALQIAKMFYAGLDTRDGTPDTSQAAQALHVAVRNMRARYPQSPSLWAAYLQAGL